MPPFLLTVAEACSDGPPWYEGGRRLSSTYICVCCESDVLPVYCVAVHFVVYSHFCVLSVNDCSLTVTADENILRRNSGSCLTVKCPLILHLFHVVTGPNFSSVASTCATVTHCELYRASLSYQKPLIILVYCGISYQWLSCLFKLSFVTKETGENVLSICYCVT